MKCGELRISEKQPKEKSYLDYLKKSEYNKAYKRYWIKNYRRSIINCQHGRNN